MSPHFTDFCTFPSTIKTGGSFTPILFFLISLFSLSSSSPSDFVLQNVFEHKDQCYKDSFVYVKKSDTEKSPSFSMYSTTKECSQKFKEEKLPMDMPYCSPGLIDLEVKPVYVPKSQISYPYANLNISVTAHSRVDTIAFRLECLSTSDGSDVYCSNSKAMYIDGVKEWPCRGIHLSSRVKYPARFSYACFRLTSHSIYAINATVLPQRCRVSTVLTAPNFEDLYPAVLVDPTINQSTIAARDPDWAPMISADISEESGIWIHLAKAEKAECDTMMINIYKEHDDNAQKVTFLQTLTVQCPENTVKWENQVAGRYLLTAYVPVRGCKFMCDSKSERGCRQCLRTHLNLIIHKNRVSMVWLAVSKMKDYSFEIFIGSISILCFVLLMVLGVFLVTVWKRRREAKRIREIQLSTYVKAMIVYSDDNDHHVNCIKYLVECLRNCATCEPIFDLEKLISAEQLVPSRWLVDQISSLPKFIIVMSDCAEKILDTEASETHQLVQTRPFTDLFAPAIEMIIRDVTENSSQARKKYAVVRFAYSPKVPPNLAILNLPTFNLPDQFGHLTAFLHDLEDVDQMNITQNLSQGRIEEWRHTISQHSIFTNENPNWIDSRWKPKDELAVIQFKRQSPVIVPIDTDKDRMEASRMFNLEPPGADSEEDEEEEVEEIHQPSTSDPSFVLYPAGEDDSEPDSEEDHADDIEETKKMIP